jgi:hypothetical protein
MNIESMRVTTYKNGNKTIVYTDRQGNMTVKVVWKNKRYWEANDAHKGARKAQNK